MCVLLLYHYIILYEYMSGMLRHGGGGCLTKPLCVYCYYIIIYEYMSGMLRHGGGGVLSLYTLYMSGILWHGGRGGAEARGGC